MRQWIELLTESNLLRHFDAASVQRGAASTRLVQDAFFHEHPDGSVELRGRVPGTQPMSYETLVLVSPSGTRARDPWWIESFCTCPVSRGCKHGAALALAAGRSLAGSGARAEEDPSQVWEHELTSLATELAEHIDPPQEPLALQVQHRPRTRSYWGRLEGGTTLRLLARGKRQRWIKSGATWNSLHTRIRRQSIPADVAAALAALQSARDRGYHPEEESRIADFGARLPQLLLAALDAGVEIVPAGGLAAVTVHPEPLPLAGHVAPTDEGLSFLLGLSLGERVLHGEEIELIGMPQPAAVAVLDSDDRQGLHLHIAPLAHPLSPQSVRLLTEEAVSVPAADQERFLDRLRPVIQHLPVHSTDGNVDLPEPLDPVLVLTVRWQDGTTAALAWSWHYGEGHECPLGSSSLLGGRRRPAAEREILQQIPEWLRDRPTVSGGDALAFVLHDLPHLRSLTGLVIREEEENSFREAESDPEISLELAPTSGGAQDWFDLEVTITVDGEAVPLAEVVAALTRGDELLVLPSGLYVPTALPEFTSLREAVEGAAALGGEDPERIRASASDLNLWAELAEIAVLPAEAQAWAERARALRDLEAIPQPEPARLLSELRPYQREGFWWLDLLRTHGLGGILADDMGLGKTLQVLATISRAVDQGTESPFLVVAPTSVLAAWEEQVRTHAPHLRLGVVQRRRDDIDSIAQGSDIVVTTYALLRLEAEAWAERDWAGLILDEAQHVKNHLGKTHAAARKIRAGFRLAMTGTPMENRLMELWSLLALTVPGLYPDPRGFGELVARPVEREGDATALERLRRTIRPFMLRRTKEVVAADLPPKQEQILAITLDAKHRKLYDTYLTKQRQRILGLVEDFDRNRVAIFAALTTLRQLALDPALVNSEAATKPSAKTEALIDHLTHVVSEGHRALVFSQFTSYLSRVRERLEEAGIPFAYLDGSTRDRSAVVQSFRAGEAPVFLISLKAGGSGLTLTEADYVFVLDPWWNPAVEAQAVDRAHRIGQDRPVHVYRLIVDGTIEEKVMALKASKAELFSQVIDGDGAAGATIDAEDIRALFTD